MLGFLFGFLVGAAFYKFFGPGIEDAYDAWRNG